MAATDPPRPDGAGAPGAGDLAGEWALAPPIYRNVYRACYGGVRSLLRVRVRGVENAPALGPLVLAVSHVSYVDPFAVGVAFPRPVHWLGKKEVFANRFWTWFFAQGGVIPVDRAAKGGNAEVFRAALANLEAGRVVGIYPEGTRSPVPGKLLPGKTGVVRLAHLAGAAVLPMAVASDLVWSKTMTMPRFGRPTYVNVGRPIAFSRDAEAAEDVARTRKATDDVMDEIQRLLDEAIAARDAGEPWARPRKVRPA